MQTGSESTNPFTCLHQKGGNTMGLVVTKGTLIVGIPSSFNHASHFVSDHSAHVGLLTIVTGLHQFFHSDPGHSPIQHSSAKLDGGP